MNVVPGATPVDERLGQPQISCERGPSRRSPSPVHCPETFPPQIRLDGRRHGTGIQATKSPPETAFNVFLSQGWAEHQAAGIVGNLQAECGYALNCSIGSGGLAQWQAERVTRFRHVFGYPFAKATFKDQLSYIQWELTHPTEPLEGVGVASSRAPRTQPQQPPCSMSTMRSLQEARAELGSQMHERSSKSMGVGPHPDALHSFRYSALLKRGSYLKARPGPSPRAISPSPATLGEKHHVSPKRGYTPSHETPPYSAHGTPSIP